MVTHHLKEYLTSPSSNFCANVLRPGVMFFCAAAVDEAPLAPAYLDFHGLQISFSFPLSSLPKLSSWKPASSSASVAKSTLLERVNVPVFFGEATACPYAEDRSTLDGGSRYDMDWEEVRGLEKLAGFLCAVLSLEKEDLGLRVTWGERGGSIKPDTARPWTSN